MKNSRQFLTQSIITMDQLAQSVFKEIFQIYVPKKRKQGESCVSEDSVAEEGKLIVYTLKYTYTCRILE